MSSPYIARVTPFLDEDANREREHWINRNIEIATDRVQREIPARFAEAFVTVREVHDWVTDLVVRASRVPAASSPTVGTGPSLLLLGPTGSGKTHQAWGAVRGLAVSGAGMPRWQFSTAASIYAKLRPRHGVDSEAEFDRYVGASLLVVDDLGAAKDSEWTEEINYRLVNHRYEHGLPTLITSNVPVRDLVAKLGERVASRLNEMAHRVVLDGGDRRKGGVRVVSEPHRPARPRVVET